MAAVVADPLVVGLLDLNPGEEGQRLLDGEFASAAHHHQISQSIITSSSIEQTPNQSAEFLRICLACKCSRSLKVVSWFSHDAEQAGDEQREFPLTK